jgi:hypothetical protein
VSGGFKIKSPTSFFLFTSDNKGAKQKKKNKMEASIFSPSLIKGLTDKIYDRRKAAALEIER